MGVQVSPLVLFLLKTLLQSEPIMKRLLISLLLVGVVGCGSDSSPSSENSGSPAEAPDADPVAALKNLDGFVVLDAEGEVTEFHFASWRSKKITDAGLVHL